MTTSTTAPAPAAARRRAEGVEERRRRDRRVGDGPERRRLYRLLRVRLRDLDQEHGHPGGPVALGPQLRRARREERDEAEDGARGRRGLRQRSRSRSQRRLREEARRLLRLLHGRAGHREGRHRAAASVPRGDRQGARPASFTKADRLVPRARPPHVLRPRLRAGLEGRDAGDRRHLPGWARPAGPRLLLEGRRQVEGHPGEVPRAPRAHLRAPRRAGGQGEGRRGHGDARWRPIWPRRRCRAASGASR